MKVVIELVAALLLINCSQDVQGTSQTVEKRIEALTTNESIRKVLFKWHKDSLGCLDLRDIKDGVFLAEQFDLQGNTKERVIEILGEPTEVQLKAEWVDGVDYDDCTVFLYYCWSACKAGERPTLATGWVFVVIDNISKKVVEIRTGIS